MSWRRRFLKSRDVFLYSLVSFRNQIRRRLRRPSGPVFGPRRRLSNPFLAPDGRPLLICVRGNNRYEMLRQGFRALGGLERLGISGSDILIKPNLVGRESAAGFPNYPTMSEPQCIADLITILRDFTGTILVGDQGWENQDKVYSALELDLIVPRAGGRLLNFERMPGSLRRVRHELWEASAPDYFVFSSVHQASFVFNLCTLKRHFRAGMTCALKNWIGAVEGRLSWGIRKHLHRHPDLSEAFLRELVFPASLINPELTIVDALDIMVGGGPYLTNPGAGIEKGVGRIVISGDMTAVDSYCAEHILSKYDPGFIPESIHPTLQEAENLGLGTADLSKIKILEIDAT